MSKLIKCDMCKKNFDNVMDMNCYTIAIYNTHEQDEDGMPPIEYNVDLCGECLPEFTSLFNDLLGGALDAAN